MGRMLFVVLLAMVAVLLGTESAWARHRGCGHTRGCHGHRGGHGRHHGCRHSGCASGGCVASGCALGGAGYYASLDAMGQPGLMMVAAEAPATLVVHLPEDAVLTVDNQEMVSTSATRVLASPPLEQGKDFIYTVRAKVVRAGQAQSISQEVTVRAGEETHVTLEIPEASLAAK